MSYSTATTYRPVVALALVIFAHIAFWQLLRQQHGSLRHDESSRMVKYLDLFDAVLPKPPPKPAPASPATVAEKIASKSKPASKPRPAASTQASSTRETPSAPVAVSSTARAEGDAPATLDLDAIRSSALSYERQRKPSEIEQMQASHRRQDSLEKRLGEGTRRAEKKDCLKAYSGIGLLAVIPLAVSTVVDTGCKW